MVRWSLTCFLSACLAVTALDRPEGVREELWQGLDNPATIQREWKHFTHGMGDNFQEALEEAISVANAGMPVQALAMFRYAATLGRDSNTAMNLAVTELRAGHLRRAYNLMLWALQTDPSSDITQQNWDDLFGRSSSLPPAITDADILTLNEELRAGLSFNTSSMFDHHPTPEDILGLRELEAVESKRLDRLQAPEFRPLPRLTPAQLALPVNAHFAQGRRAFVLTGIFTPHDVSNPGTPLPSAKPLMTATDIVEQFAHVHGRKLSKRTLRSAFFSKSRNNELMDAALYRHSLWSTRSFSEDTTLRGAVKHMKASAKTTASQRSPYSLWRPDPVAWDTVWNQLNLTQRLPQLFQMDRVWLGPAMTTAGAPGWQRSQLELELGLGKPGASIRSATEATELANEFTDLVRWRLAPIGTGGAGMFLHFDGVHLPSWQLQLAGRKTWIICPGSEAQRLYDAGFWHHMGPPWKKIPLVKIALCFNTTLYPGEAIFYPKGYFHGTYNHPSIGSRWDADDGLVVSFSGSAVTSESTHRIQTIITRECETRAKVNMTEQLSDFTTGGNRVKVVKKASASLGVMQGIPSEALCKALRDHLFDWWQMALHGTWLPGSGLLTCSDGFTREPLSGASPTGEATEVSSSGDGGNDGGEEDWGSLESWDRGIGL